MNKAVRVRFAPSPTGGLHIGGLRTALFNYLFAKKHGGTFILRIEDTDQKRYVEGAEKYIVESLKWAGLVPQESPAAGGEFVPYRQSERTKIYQKYAQQLLAEQKAYYAFDTAEELAAMRTKLEAAKVVFQYNAITRMQMKNSLTLSAQEVKSRLEAGDSYTIRFKIPVQQEVILNDIIRGKIKIQSHTLDDKVLMKSDGLPTYHLANVVDDYLMKISHVIRGEEWLPSLPLHVLLYKALGFEESMPAFAHLPLIMKPNGKGKLSKRDAQKGDFPIFPLDWTDPKTGNKTDGFKEAGYLPEALLNFLGLLGWNSGTEQELFTLEELTEAFSLERVTKAGSKFDPEKLKWFNQQYLRNRPNAELAKVFTKELAARNIKYDASKIERIASLVKERVTFMADLWGQGAYFFETPQNYDEKVIKKRWTQEAVKGLSIYVDMLENWQGDFDTQASKEKLNEVLTAQEMKIGKMMQPLRVALTGQGVGADIVEVMDILGKQEMINRIKTALEKLKDSVK